ncbi:hypothetical protein Tco_1121725 [Tanacetum coccineum]|uniref:Uncharacterized protein n=1 Tax=Tanacetum coccineum TaxID=301880 RepID=A0ABQ5IYI2_9ASTR
MERNKSIHRSDEQKNHYKALVEAYESDNLILNTYGDTISTQKEKTPKSIEGSKSLHKFAGESAHAEDPIHTAKDFKEPAHQEFETGATEDQPVDENPQPSDWFQKPTTLPSPNLDWNKTLPTDHRLVQPCLSNLAQEEGPCESFVELMDTPLDFSAFMMNWLKVDTLTPELLAGPTFELMKGTCKSLLYRLITSYLSGGVSSQTYATSITKTKAADYGHIKWIGDLVPNTMWSEVPVNYDKHALWEFLIGDANINNSMDLLPTGNLLITVHRDDDKLYTFKEEDFKRLLLQDIKDMLIFLTQGRLKNLNIEDRIAFGVSLRMFTRSIIIQRCVEDLQLGVESYQKKLNITKPDTYRFDIKHRDAYTAYSNPRGFIYQNKYKNNKLMHIDELHKFSDGTLNDVQTAFNDRLKEIRMEYLP